jgi:hypothetical protein
MIQNQFALLLQPREIISQGRRIGCEVRIPFLECDENARLVKDESAVNEKFQGQDRLSRTCATCVARPRGSPPCVISSSPSMPVSALGSDLRSKFIVDGPSSLP